MKTFLIMLLLLIPVATFAGECRVYEYTEIKDMNEEELSAAMLKAEENALIWITASNKSLDIAVKHGSTPADDRARAEEDKKFNICLDQEMRFRDMLKKKYPGSKYLKK